MKSEVERHYSRISDSYDKDLNLYCQARFIDIIKKYCKGNVLEVGCGTGYVQNRLKQKTFGMDITLSLLDKNKNSVVCGNAENIPFRSSTFDVVYSINLLEHVKNPCNVVSECKRVLKKNGRLILITPSKDVEKLLDIAEKFKLKIPEGPHRFLAFEELKDIVIKNNMKIISSEKFVLFPMQLGIITRIFEKMERLFPYFCIFNLVVCKK